MTWVFNGFMVGVQERASSDGRPCMELEYLVKLLKEHRSIQLLLSSASPLLYNESKGNIIILTVMRYVNKKLKLAQRPLEWAMNQEMWLREFYMS